MGARITGCGPEPARTSTSTATSLTGAGTGDRVAYGERALMQGGGRSTPHPWMGVPATTLIGDDGAVIVRHDPSATEAWTTGRTAIGPTRDPPAATVPNATGRASRKRPRRSRAALLVVALRSMASPFWAQSRSVDVCAVQVSVRVTA